MQWAYNCHTVLCKLAHNLYFTADVPTYCTTTRRVVFTLMVYLFLFYFIVHASAP